MPRLADSLLVIAHRGASGYAPEHTFPSWDMAAGMGADYLEQDLQMTRDGHLVVLHDPTLERTTDGACRGPVIERTLDELRGCDVGRWFNRAFPDRARAEYEGLRIPTLDEVLDRYGPEARYYIETKNPGDAPGMEEALLALLDRHGLRDAAAERRQVLIQSFSAASLRKIRGMDARLPLIQLLSRRPGWWTRPRLRRIAEYAVGIGPDRRMVDRALVDAAHELGLHVHPYTVDEPAEMRRLADLGVDGMFTNFPDRLIDVRDGDPA